MKNTTKVFCPFTPVSHQLKHVTAAEGRQYSIPLHLPEMEVRTEVQDASQFHLHITQMSSSYYSKQVPNQHQVLDAKR